MEIWVTFTTDLAVSYCDMQLEVIALEVCPFEAYIVYSSICGVAILWKSYINDFSFPWIWVKVSISCVLVCWTLLRVPKRMTFRVFLFIRCCSVGGLVHLMLPCTQYGPSLACLLDLLIPFSLLEGVHYVCTILSNQINAISHKVLMKKLLI